MKQYGFPRDSVPHFYGPCGLYFKRIAFDNGYAVSIVSHRNSYGGDLGLFEIAVMNAKNNQIVYCTPITHDVLPSLDFAEVADVIAKVEALPKRNWVYDPPCYSPMEYFEREERRKNMVFAV